MKSMSVMIEAAQAATPVASVAQASGRRAPLHAAVRRFACSMPCIALALAFAVMVFGIATLLLKAGRVCGGFPLCNGELRPMGDTMLLTARLHSHWSHRVFSFLLEIVVLAGTARAWLGQTSNARIRRACTLAAAAVTAELMLGAALVGPDFGLMLRVMHGVVGAAAIVSLAVWAAADTRVRSAYRVP